MKNVNEDEIIDLIRLGEHKPLSIRFIEFMPFDQNQWHFEKTFLLDDVLDVVRNVYPSVSTLINKHNSTVKGFKVPGFLGDFGVISTVSAPFCGTCNRMRLTSDGKMKNCLFASTESDLLGAYRKKDDLTPLIEQNIFEKKEVRGGMESQDQITDMGQSHPNRSMVSIGG